MSRMRKKYILVPALLVLLYLILPFFLPAPGIIPTWPALFLFYLACGLAVLFAGRSGSARLNEAKRRKQALREKLNVARDLLRREEAARRALKEKIARYSSLKSIIEQVNESMALDVIAQKFSEICFSLIGRSRGVCALFLADESSHSLKLHAARKLDSSLVLKAKEGDIFDSWVHRHAQPLMIEDITRDFRFDRDTLSREPARAVGSLISAPLFAGSDFLGVIRLDHPDAGYFNQDDFRFLVALSDIGAVALENARLYEHTQDLAIHDGLTGLFTKAHFFQLLAGECGMSMRRGRAFSLLMIDIDFFKRYNDSFGHAAGDMVLKALSKTLAQFAQDHSGIACRFGGEEFCVLLPHKHKQDGVACAEALRRTVEKIAVSLRRQETPVTVSVGVAAFPADANEAQELVKRADKAMYEAKRAGRNRVAGA